MADSRLTSNLWRVMHEREIRNVSQAVKACGVSRGTINKLYTGKHLSTIRIGTLAKVCDGLRCELKDLVEYRV